MTGSFSFCFVVGGGGDLLYDSAGISFREGFKQGLKEGGILFKNTERKLYEIGFKQTKWDKHGFRYERQAGYYIHVVDFVTKLNTSDILQSYNKNNDRVVGLTLKEMELFSKRIREWARSVEGMFR